MEKSHNGFEEDKQRFRFQVTLAIVILIGLAAVGWRGRSAYRHYKERHSLAQAQAFLASGDYRNALLSARQTLLLNPTNVPVCRVMVALAELSHSPAVLDWQRRIVQTEPTVENKLLLASSGLRYQSPPFPLTAQIMDELAATATNRANYQVVAASLALGTRRLAEAEAHFEIAVQLEPTNRLHELQLAILRLGATNETKVAAARAVLETLRTDATFGPSALRALVADRLAHHDAAAANGYSTQVLASARATLSDRLQQLGILQQLQRAEFAAGLQAVQQQTNATAVAEVSAWMQANGLLAENIQWLTNLPAKLQAQSPVRLALANGYLQSEDWRSLRNYATTGDWEEMDFLRLALVARAWSQLGVANDLVAEDLRSMTDYLQASQRTQQALTNGQAQHDSQLRLQVAKGNWKSQEYLRLEQQARARTQLSTARVVAEGNWGSAVTAAGNRYGALTMLLGLAERWQWKHESEDLLERIVQQLPQERWAQNELELVYLASGDTASLQQLYSRLFAIFPQDVGLKNNLAATSLLLKTNLPQACQWAAEVYGKRSNDLIVVSTYAYALHLQGRTQDGLAALQKLDDFRRHQPDAALYYGVLLAASGATNEAAPFLKIAQTKTLWLPEEKQLLSAALGEP